MDHALPHGPSPARLPTPSSKTRRRSVALGGLALVVALGAASCSSGSSGRGSDTTANAGPDSTTAEAGTPLPTTDATTATTDATVATAATTDTTDTTDTTEVPDTSAAPRLPLDPPSTDVLQASPRKVFAHYVTSFPVSIDNEPADADYYATQFLVASGEDGKFAASGGYIRERPLPRPVIAAGTWLLDDMRTEVRRAISAGIDGFTLDLLSLTGNHWSAVQRMLAAAQAVDPNFAVVLVPDGATDTLDDPELLAAKIASVADHPSTYHLDDGRLVVAPFFAENQSVAWWTSWIALMDAEYGIEVALVPTVLDPESAAAFSEIAYGYSFWGDRSPASIVDTASYADAAHAAGKLWMQPVAVQDARPSGGIFSESNNTETLRTLWTTAIDSGAEWVQLVTWNDYSEGTEFAPSSHIGWAPLDISQYYINWFKTGAEPAIERDAVFVSHRIQPWAAEPTGTQTELMELVSGSSPARDGVELLTFLVEPQRVVVHIGESAFDYRAPAGVSAEVLPLAPGTVTVTIEYADGTTLVVSSSDEIVERPEVQDLQYHFASSTRDDG